MQISYECFLDKGVFENSLEIYNLTKSSIRKHLYKNITHFENYTYMGIKIIPRYLPLSNYTKDMSEEEYYD